MILIAMEIYINGEEDQMDINAVTLRPLLPLAAQTNLRMATLFLRLIHPLIGAVRKM